MPFVASLACTVRGCGRPLSLLDRALVCPSGHSFDLARTGYINLLQPQDRRSPTAGDAKAIVDARAALIAAGAGRALIDGVVRDVLALDLDDAAVVVDLGSGSGDALGALASRRTIEGIGIDLSAAAAEHASRRFPALTWVVANADRRLPLLDGSVSVVISINGRRNPAECARVLNDRGRLIVAQPAAEDLIELRRFLHGEERAIAHPRPVAVEHQEFFSPVHETTIRERLLLDREALRRVLLTTYRGARQAVAHRLEELNTMEVTFSSTVVVLRKKKAGPAETGTRPEPRALTPADA